MTDPVRRTVARALLAGCVLLYPALSRAADWTLTFRYSYDVDFPPGTTLGDHDFRSRGADQASPANQHLHSFGARAIPRARFAEYLQQHLDLPSKADWPA